MYTIDKNQFGSFVARLRKEKGYTQKELAAQLFVSDKAVSKWETGASIPDTALLVPLAELLGVTVTELLLCRKNTAEALTTAEAEQAVQTAIGYETGPSARVWKSGSPMLALYLVSLLVAAVGSAANIQCGFGNEPLFVYLGLFAGFGAYFCLFARQYLPDIYDKAAISFMSDGIVRMNLPGVHFNNRNWPHVLRVGQIWCVASLNLFPWVYLVLHLLPVSSIVVSYICPFLSLGGLFLPLCIVGKKYEIKTTR